MEITKTCDVKELNNDTERPMTLGDFKREYLDPEIVQWFDDFDKEVTQYGKEVMKLSREFDRTIRETNRLLAELKTKSDDKNK